MPSQIIDTVRISREDVGQICPSCAANMQRKGIAAYRVPRKKLATFLKRTAQKAVV